MMHRAYLCKQAGFVPAHPAEKDDANFKRDTIL
jgi:hypothetical protein